MIDAFAGSGRGDDESARARPGVRLLVIGHSYVTAFAQGKYAAMKRQQPTLKLRILVPKQVPHIFMTYAVERTSGLAPGEVIPLATMFPFRSHMTYLFWPRELYRSMKDFEPDIIYVEEEPHALIAAQTALWAGRAAPRARMCVFTWDNLYRPRKFPVGLAKRALGTYSLRRCTAVVCGNRDAQGIVRGRRQYQGLTAVLPQLGLDPEEHHPGQEQSLRKALGLDGAVNIGYVGRFVPEKGLVLLLRALERLERYPWELLLVGAGPLEGEIRTEWMARFQGRIVLVPAVPHRDVPKYLRCLDIFVLPSYATRVWKEQFGLVLAQAMMVGLPTVGSTSGAIPEVLGPAGLIFPERDVEGLAATLETLLASEERRRELGAGAREFALRNYTMAALGARYLALFERVGRPEGGRDDYN